MKALLLVTAAAGVLSACAAPIALGGSVAPVSASRSAEASTLRIALPLTTGWRFRQDDGLQGAEQPDFADQAWEQVRVPHTWNRVGNYLDTSRPHPNTVDTINKTQGVGWYRLTFTPPATLEGKRAWLQFDAASRTAEVWLNGVRLGDHRGGFSRFRLDATAAIKPGEANVLVVKTDNSDPNTSPSTRDVLPLKGDFFVHGGLYRPVTLIGTSLIHIDMEDFGGPGVYATTTKIEGDRAEVEVQTRLRNDGPQAEALTVMARLVDVAGRVAAQDSQVVRIEAGQGGTSTQSLVLGDARLWQGVEDPYLYRLEVEIQDSKGTPVDGHDQAFGVRQIRIDPEKGVFLNDRQTPLRGVGYHQDREGEGWAVSPEQIEEDVRTLLEMGANTIRLTHYQHGPVIHELADRYGLILWDEIPLVSAWTNGGAAEPSEALLADADQQLAELIRQNQNHASVMTWGIANEVDFGNSLPGFLTGGVSVVPPDPMPLLNRLDDLAKTLDPSRPTALANCCEGRIFAADAAVPTTAVAADLNGANRYFGWYYGRPDELGAHLDRFRNLRPDQPISLSEYGAGGAVTMHTDNPLGGPVDMRGRNQPEEYQSWVHEENWRQIKDRSYLWATWLWVGFDFATTIRREGDADDINTKGLVTYDRAVRKDAFYFYKANWSGSPTVHINGRRYTDRAYQFVDMSVYSNAASTDLLVNGESVGVRTACPQFTCSWRIKLAPGQNRVVARASFADGPVQDEVEWILADEAARVVRIDSGALMAARSSNGRFGSDTFFEGGMAGTTDIPPAGYGRPATARPIVGSDTDVARTFRSGAFTYAVPLADGDYSVTLTFVEPQAEVGERVFDVLADGVPVLDGIDVRALSGGLLTELRREVRVTVRNGILTLRFEPRTGSAIVSGIEIVRN